MKANGCEWLLRTVGLGVLAPLLLWSGAAAAQTAAIPAGTEVGQRYPNYTFPSMDGGKLTSLSEFRGKKILLFQFASW